MSAAGGKIFSNNKGSATSITLSGCKVIEPAVCKLGNSEGKEVTAIVTSAVTTLVEQEGSTLAVKLSPVTQPFTTIDLLGCAAEGSFELHGTARATVATTTEEILKVGNANTASGGRLRFGVEASTLIGSLGLTLSGTSKGLVWGVN